MLTRDKNELSQTIQTWYGMHGMKLGYPRNDMILEFESHRLVLGAVIRRGLELYECLLVENN